MTEERMECFVKLLDNKCTLHSELVPVLTEFYPHEVIPSITFDLTGKWKPVEEVELKLYEKLSPDHPHYDPANPNEQWIQIKRRVTLTENTMSIHGWTTDIDNRDSLYNQVFNLLEDARDLQYNQCRRYNPQTHVCSKTGAECDARTQTTIYSINGRCPYLDITDPLDAKFRDFQPILPYYNIERTLDIHAPDFILEDNTSPIMYRFIIDVDFLYQTTVDRAVAPTIHVNKDDSDEFME